VYRVAFKGKCDPSKFHKALRRLLTFGGSSAEGGPFQP
jgi:hypothetical protein